MTLPDEPDSVARARAAIRVFAGNCGADAGDLALAVSEAVTNALIHGYREGASGAIEVRAWVDDGDCVIEVVDRGVGMSPHPESNGLGLGLPVITKVADAVEIVAGDPGTAIRMRFKGS